MSQTAEAGPPPRTSALFSAAGRLLRRRSMRSIVRWFTRAHVVAYRSTGGRAQFGRYPMLLLTVPGRRTGRERTTPLLYARDGARYVIAASYAGSDDDPVWWLNLREVGEAVVEIAGARTRVRAALATPGERAALWERLCAIYPYFVEYQERTERTIPVVVLAPLAGRSEGSPGRG